jgi:serine/threonine-protein kinase
VDDAVQITREIADALAYASERGVIHRDVKPANILIEAGHAVLADFGVAYAMAEARDERITKTGMSLGTPAYMSPEQATGERELDGRSDQYALGCVLYEMLAGQPPFTGATGESVIRQHLTAEAPPVTQLRSSVPGPVARALTKALSKAPADRFATTAGLGDALVEQDGPSRGPPRRWKHLAAGIGIAAVAIAAVAAASLIQSSGRHTGPPSLAILPPEAPGAGTGATFAHGVADAVYMRLIPVSGLTVKGFYNADQYDRRGKTYRQIGEELGAKYLLDLRISREAAGDQGGMVRASADLIRASDEEAIWGDTYEEEFESVSAINRTIAEHVVQELDIRLAAPERQALALTPTSNPLAWEYFQQGKRMDLSGASRPINLQAAELYEKAIAEDSMFALAYARLAAVLFYAGGEEPVRRGQEAVVRARQLSPDLPEIRLAEGGLLYTRGQYEPAADEYRAVLRERPSDTEALQYVGISARRLGKWDEALETFRRAFELAPLYPNVVWNLALCQLYLRDYREAGIHLDRYMELSPQEGLLLAAEWRAWLRLVAGGDVPGAEQILRQAAEELGLETVLTRLASGESRFFWFGLPDWGFRQDLKRYSIATLDADSLDFLLARAVSEQAEGDAAAAMTIYESARIVAEPWVRARPGRAGSHGYMGILYAGMGRRDEAIRESEEGVRLRPVSSDDVMGSQSLMYLARTSVLVGDYERAIELLEDLVTKPSMWSKTWLRLHPFFDPLRDHPRFQALADG